MKITPRAKGRKSYLTDLLDSTDFYRSNLGFPMIFAFLRDYYNGMRDETKINNKMC